MIRQLITAVVIVVLASAIGLASNAVRSEPMSLVQNWAETLSRRNEVTLPSGLVALDLKRVSETYQADNVLVIDARLSDFWSMERISGAKNIPVDEADQILPSFLKNVPSTTRIITYCDGAACHDAQDLGVKILEAGHKDVAVFLGGMIEWQDEGMPVESDD